MEESSTKGQQKLSDGNGDNISSIDRLGALPDDVVRRILSFLPTKISVSTSILSKRWRLLWTHVPSLDINSNNHLSGMEISNIFNRAMLLNRIDTFRLVHTISSIHNESIISDDDLEMWIATVTDRNVQNIDIWLDYEVILPQPLFTSKTLVDLRLCFCGDIPMTGTIYLPSLKKLYLWAVIYESDESLPHLLSGCPLLEELVIVRANGDKMISCYIASPTLITLTIAKPGFEDSKILFLKLDTPALRQQ